MGEAAGHSHVWMFAEQRGWDTSTHLAITVVCRHDDCDEVRTAPVTAEGIARNSIQALQARHDAQGVPPSPWRVRTSDE